MRLAAVYFLSQQLLRQIVQQIVLYGTFHRTGTEFRVIPCIGKEVYGGICQNQFHTVTGKSFALASLKASIRENFPDTQLSLMILFLNDIYRRFLSITPPKYRRWCSAP